MPTTQQAASHLATNKRYVEEQINGSNPIQLLLKLYDVAITSCTREDRQRLSRAIVELISALNFEHREVALGLFRLYNYCLRNAKLGNFDAVKPILCELRDTWSSTQNSPAPED